MYGRSMRSYPVWRRNCAVMAGPLARVARIGADVAELLARVARRPLVNRHAEAEFWHRVGQRG